LISTESASGDQPLFRPGLRVRCLNTQRQALVVGFSEYANGTKRLVPVIIEGSTRHELWGTNAMEPLEQELQCSTFRGRFIPPKGYPLIPPPER
jgi:hypothetical protein